ncbi:hypothetical protein H0H92_010428 [Tricholoma furcatifolium]|nr:hypothetical protein H0H92_010428 [Tricholoma furcatifolium]
MPQDPYSRYIGLLSDLSAQVPPTSTQTEREASRYFYHRGTRFSFNASDISIMTHPKHLLNDVCLNEITALLQRHFSQTSTSSIAAQCTLFTTFDLLLVRYNVSDSELWRRSRRAEEFLGFAKSEAFHQKALAATRERKAHDAANVGGPKAEVASAALPMDPVATEDATGSVKGPTAEALRTFCKAALFALYGHPLLKESKAKGKGNATDATDSNPSGQLPWNTLPLITATEGLQMSSWPWGIEFPGQPGSKSQGIKALPTDAARALLAALNGETGTKPTLQAVPNAEDVRSNVLPIMLTVAPPPGSAEKYGHVIFANGTVEKCSEKFGIPREDAAPKAAPKNVNKRSTPPPPARVMRSKKKTAKAEEEPPSHNVEGKNQARKPLKAPQQPKAAGSHAAPVVVSSDSETSGSGTGGMSSLSAESAVMSPHLAQAHIPSKLMRTTVAQSAECLAALRSRIMDKGTALT